MDRTSVKVLKYIKQKDGAVCAEQIIKKFGRSGAQSLSMLCDEEYLSRSLERMGPEQALCTVYYIEPRGRDFLEHRFGDIFDKWLGRASAIFPILGGALLSKPLWAILEWSWDKVLLIWEWICRWF